MVWFGFCFESTKIKILPVQQYSTTQQKTSFRGLLLALPVPSVLRCVALGFVTLSHCTNSAEAIVYEREVEHSL
jgi:hypothetical protein